ncbi:MAG: hypothetical protein JWO03_3863 [Bacteroidetes bacterium]|nr:hypothetical protein [Bacteroidota bacterium]
MARSSSHERRVDAYLRPTLLTKLSGYVARHEVSESSVVNDALEEFFSKRNITADVFKTNGKRRDHQPE